MTKENKNNKVTAFKKVTLVTADRSVRTKFSVLRTANY